MSQVKSDFIQTKPWPDPTPDQLNSYWFNQIWNVIKDWDIAVDGAYFGYCGATGNHVRAILDAINTKPGGALEEFDQDEQWR